MQGIRQSQPAKQNPTTEPPSKEDIVDSSDESDSSRHGYIIYCRLYSTDANIDTNHI